jgi:hypothetical protein
MNASLFGSAVKNAKSWAARRSFSKSAEKRLYSAVAVMQNLESRQLLSAVNPFPGPTIVNPEVTSNLKNNGAPFAIAVADLNGDGIPDVVTANSDGSITVTTQYSDQNSRGTGELYYNSKTSSIDDHLGAGSGNAHDLAVGTAPDGDPIIIVANGGDDISVIAGDGHGGFNTAYTIDASSGGVDGLAFVSDLPGIGDASTNVVTANHDGTVTLIDSVYGTGGANVDREISLGSGSHLYSPEEINLGGSPEADTGLLVLDGDGNLLFQNSRGGTSTIQQHVEAFAVGQLYNGGGGTDLVTLSTYSGGIQTLKTFIGSDGSLSAHSNGSFNSNIGSTVELADLNGDGNLDAIVTKYSGGAITQTGFTGDGYGDLGSSTSFATNPIGSVTYPALVQTLADMNGDGKSDLVYAYKYGSGGIDYPVGVRLNSDTAVTSVPQFTSPNIAFFPVGSNDSFTIKTTGAPDATLTYSGTLPDGLTFTPDGNGTATLTGDATDAGGEFDLTIYAHNTAGSATPQHLLVDEIGPTTATVGVGTDVVAAITPAGYDDTVTFLNSDSYPNDGIVLTGNSASGYTLEADQDIATPPGQYLVDLSLSNGVNRPVIEALTVNVVAPVVYTSPDDVAFAKGHFGSFTVTTNSSPLPGSDVNLDIVAGFVPPGLDFIENDNGTATLEGTPTKDGHFTITVNADNGIFTTSQQNISITIEPARKPTINLKDPTFQLGTPAFYAISTTGYPSVALGDLNVTGLPPGLTFTDNGDGTGEITGTPTETGYYTLTFTASNSIGSTHKSLKVLVAQPVVFTSAPDAIFDAGVFNSFLVTATGFPTADIDLLGSLPPGLKLRDFGDGEAMISGTPKKPGVFHFTLAFGTGGDIKRVLQVFTLTVQMPPP